MAAKEKISLSKLAAFVLLTLISVFAIATIAVGILNYKGVAGSEDPDEIAAAIDNMVFMLTVSSLYLFLFALGVFIYFRVKKKAKKAALTDVTSEESEEVPAESVPEEPAAESESSSDNL